MGRWREMPLVLGEHGASVALDLKAADGRAQRSILCTDSASGFGSDGLYADRPGQDLPMQA